MQYIGGTKVVWQQKLGGREERGTGKNYARSVGKDVLLTQGFVDWILKAFGCHFRILKQSSDITTFAFYLFNNVLDI